MNAPTGRPGRGTRAKTGPTERPGHGTYVHGEGGDYVVVRTPTGVRVFPAPWPGDGGRPVGR